MKTWHWIILGILTVISLIIEFTMVEGHHWWNKIPAFYAIMGFLGCMLLVYFSKWLGKLYILNNEKYYDR